MDDKDLIQMRDLFRESADIIDKLIDLQKRDKEGEDVKKELEGVCGRFMYKMIEINELSNK